MSVGVRRRPRGGREASSRAEGRTCGSLEFRRRALPLVMLVGLPLVLLRSLPLLPRRRARGQAEAELGVDEGLLLRDQDVLVGGRGLSPSRGGFAVGVPQGAPEGGEGELFPAMLLVQLGLLVVLVVGDVLWDGDFGGSAGQELDSRRSGHVEEDEEDEGEEE